jgi:hypothetical protein
MVRYVVLLLTLCFLAAVARAQTLPLPDNLIDLRSDEGEADPPLYLRPNRRSISLSFNST